MSQRPAREACEFDVETQFQKMARRPGGLPREQALRRAANNIEEIKPRFTSWLDDELDALFRAVPDTASSRQIDLSWLNVIVRGSTRLIDVAATMDRPMVGLVARHLHMICEAVRRGAPYHDDIMACHLDALKLCQQRRYRNVAPEDMPELSTDLRRALMLRYSRSA